MDLTDAVLKAIMWVGSFIVFFWLVGVPIFNWLKNDIFCTSAIPGPSDKIRPHLSYKGRLGKLKEFRAIPFYAEDGTVTCFRVDVEVEGWERACQFTTDEEGLEKIEKVLKRARGDKLAIDAMKELD